LSTTEQGVENKERREFNYTALALMTPYRLEIFELVLFDVMLGCLLSFLRNCLLVYRIVLQLDIGHIPPCD
jgi:hypothetical protein